MGKGWHGVWDAARANGNGRSGGTAVLVRRPVQLVRGGGGATGQRHTSHGQLDTPEPDAHRLVV